MKGADSAKGKETNEGENTMCKGRNKGLRGLTNGTRANEENKR